MCYSYYNIQYFPSSCSRLGHQPASISYQHSHSNLIVRYLCHLGATRNCLNFGGPFLSNHVCKFVLATLGHSLGQSFFLSSARRKCRASKLLLAPSGKHCGEQTGRKLPHEKKPVLLLMNSATLGARVEVVGSGDGEIRGRFAGWVRVSMTIICRVFPPGGTTRGTIFMPGLRSPASSCRPRRTGLGGLCCGHVRHHLTGIRQTAHSPRYGGEGKGTHGSGS